MASNELSEHSNNSQRQRQRRPDRAVYVPRGRRSQTTPPSASVQINNNSATIQGFSKNESPIANSSIPVQSSDISTTLNLSPEKVIETKKEIVKNNNIKSHPNQNESLLTENFNSASNMSKKSDAKNGSTHTASDKDYNEEKELQRASKVNIHFLFSFCTNRELEFISFWHIFFCVHSGNESSQSSNH